MKLVWDVKIGSNWNTYTVISKDFIEAGKKARKLAKEQSVDKANDYVSEVILLRVIDG